MERKDRNRTVSCLAAALILLMLFPRAAVAGQATSYTYTLDDKGEYIRTQDAYLPDRTLAELGLASPSDLFIDKNDLMYIADLLPQRRLCDGQRPDICGGSRGESSIRLRPGPHFDREAGQTGFAPVFRYEL